MVALDVGDIQENLGEKDTKSDILYTVEDTPPWYLCVVLGFQVSQSVNIIQMSHVMRKPVLAICEQHR